MKHFDKVYGGVLLIAVAFLGWSCNGWLQACSFLPQTPSPDPAWSIPLKPEIPARPASRYQELYRGTVFFGPPPPPSPAFKVAPVKPKFHSELVLQGLTCGENPKDNCAIVGIASNPEGGTWLVKPGSQVAGEQIVKIGARSIVVKNHTGVGSIVLQE